MMLHIIVRGRSSSGNGSGDGEGYRGNGGSHRMRRGTGKGDSFAGDERGGTLLAKVSGVWRSPQEIDVETIG